MLPSQQGLQQPSGHQQGEHEGAADGERDRQGVLGQGAHLQDDAHARRDEQQLQVGQQRDRGRFRDPHDGPRRPQQPQRDEQHQADHHPGHGQPSQLRRGQSHHLREQQDHEAQQHRGQGGYACHPGQISARPAGGTRLTAADAPITLPR